MARSVNYPVREIRFGDYNAVSYTRIPTINTTMHEFDFEHTRTFSNYYYVKSNVPFQRNDVLTDLSFQEKLPSLLQTAILCLEDDLARRVARRLKSDNIFVFKRVPQVEVLEQLADIMITHGGMNSIKECIQSLTPMLVYPVAYTSINTEMPQELYTMALVYQEPLMILQKRSRIKLIGCCMMFRFMNVWCI